MRPKGLEIEGLRAHEIGASKVSEFTPTPLPKAD